MLITDYVTVDLIDISVPKCYLYVLSRGDCIEQGFPKAAFWGKSKMQGIDPLYEYNNTLLIQTSV